MSNRIAIKISLIYFFLGFLWILFSDQLILAFEVSVNAITILQTYKGWFFVSVTSILLFMLIRKEIRIKNKIETDLQKAKSKAEESDHLKSAFLSNLSHEIRTPLNGILGFCELMLDNSFNSNDKELFANNLKKNGNDLLKLMNDIMDISKIQENQMIIDRKLFNLNNLLDDIYYEYLHSEARISRKNVTFSQIRLPEDAQVQLLSDPIRLMHVFKNLLNNAFFFTTEGFIRFGYENSENGLTLFVEDSGSGIDESNSELIFKPFFKGKKHIVGNKGFGLGLAISKGLVNLLGGDLKFHSEVGKGSKFYFTIYNQKIVTLKSTGDIQKK